MCLHSVQKFMFEYRIYSRNTFHFKFEESKRWRIDSSVTAEDFFPPAGHFHSNFCGSLLTRRTLFLVMLLY